MRIWNHAVKSNVPQKQLPRHRDEIRHPATTAGSVTQPNIRNTTNSQCTLLETCKRKVCNLVHVTSQASGDRLSKSNDQQTQRLTLPPGTPRRGALGLRDTGAAAQFMNLYVRDL